MTLVLNLPPATEAKLRALAALEGRAEEEIVLSAVETFLEATRAMPRRRRNILEFRGASKHNPIGTNAQAYISEMRDEWDRRS